MGEKHKNKFTPDLTSGSDLGGWESELMPRGVAGPGPRMSPAHSPPPLPGFET